MRERKYNIQQIQYCSTLYREHALSVTGYTGVGPATEWYTQSVLVYIYTECRLLSHVEDTTGRVLGTANDTESGATPVPQQAQSLKCDESVN